MQTYKVTIQGISPYSSSRKHNVPKKDRETSDDHERRTWRNKVTTDASGMAIINPMAFKFCLVNASKYLGMQVPGKGKRTYAKIFASGILIDQPLPLPACTDVDTLKYETEAKPGEPFGRWVSCHSNGKRDSGSRVDRCFPMFPVWGGTLVIRALDDAITKDVLEAHLYCAGAFIGVGQGRPENCGLNGRFEVKSIEAIETKPDKAI